MRPTLSLRELDDVGGVGGVIIVVVESSGCVCVCGRKEEDVSFSEHNTHIGRERVRASITERGIFGDTSLCTRHLR